MKMVKKIIAVVMACCLLLTTLGLMSTAAAKVLCDVNSDEAVNAKDVLRLKQYLAQWTVVIDADCSDCNRDKAVNAKDLLIIRQALANIIPIPTFAVSTTAPTATAAPNTTVAPTTTATPTQPVTIGNLPDGYPTEMANCSVNQVGYSTNAKKLAKVLFDDFGDKTAVCYLIDASTGKTVKTAETPTKRFDITMDGYVADFDFSEITAQGSYFVATPRGVSPTFKIADNPYVDVQKALVTALYYNRCGCALDEKIVGPKYVHAACHVGETRVTVLNLFDNALGKYKDNGVHQTADEFSGGLHDAGDYGRYVVPGNQVVASGIYATELFPKGENVVNLITDKPSENISDALDEARYEMEWILKMQNPTSGAVYYRLVSKAFADWTDKPDDDSNFTDFGLFCSYEHLKSTSGMVGNAAACYTAFKDIDLDFANRCLAAAKKGYAYVKANMNNSAAHKTYAQSNEYMGAGAGEYGSGSSWNEIWYSAAALMRATGEQTYKADADDLIKRKASGKISFNYSGINGYNLGGAGSIAYLKSDLADATNKTTIINDLKRVADGYRKTTSNEKFNVCLTNGGFGWGSNSTIGDHTSDCAIADYFLNTTAYEETIRDNLSFILGSNPTGYCFVTKIGAKSPQRPHHRPSIAVFYDQNKVPDPVPGWVVGGISGSTYEDADNNYQTNEVCIYWNTPVSFAMAYVLTRDIK